MAERKLSAAGTAVAPEGDDRILTQRSASNPVTTWTRVYTFIKGLLDADTHQITRGEYFYHAQSSTADTAGDWRTYSDATGFFTDYCTVGHATKGSGTWVNKFKIEI